MFLNVCIFMHRKYRQVTNYYSNWAVALYMTFIIVLLCKVCGRVLRVVSTTLYCSYTTFMPSDSHFHTFYGKLLFWNEWIVAIEN